MDLEDYVNNVENHEGETPYIWDILMTIESENELQRIVSKHHPISKKV